MYLCISLLVLYSLVDYLLYEVDTHKTELLSSLIYPLFVHCYFCLLTTSDVESGNCNVYVFLLI